MSESQEPESQHPRVVRLTPLERGAIATVLVEGPGAARLVQALFQPKSGGPLATCPIDRPILGHFLSGSQPGEELVVRRRSEASVELHCHGGYASVAAIEAALIAQGGRATSWRDWAAGHEPDPIASAARIALADASTERTSTVLLDQYHGALRRAVKEVRVLLHAGDPASASGRLDTLLARAPLGRHLVEPWRVTLAGGTNVGKSSLINALVGYGRAIVDPTPGTTRDVVTATTALDGWPVEFSDTAGLRHSDQPVERAGIELARQRLADADLVVLVFDLTRPWSDTDARLVQTQPGALVVHNKCDLTGRDLPPRAAGLSTSAHTGRGVDGLLRSIAGRLVPDPPAGGGAVPFTAAQVRQLQAARDAVAGGRLQSAVEILSRL
jgi:tRNA modification GTPase